MSPPTDSAPFRSPAVSRPNPPTTKRMKKRPRGKKRKLEALPAGGPGEQGKFPLKKKLMQQPMAMPKPNPVLKPEEKTDLKQVVTEENTVDPELSVKEQIRLAMMERKTEELQGYVNQIQDAVTIGMFQLRDLKKQIALETAGLAPAIDEEE